MSPDQPSTTRRALLAAMGATGLAGCVGSLPTGGESDETTATTTTTTASAGAADWPQLGRNAAHDSYAPQFATESEPAAAWETEVDGSLTTPIVVGETVYVTRGVPTDDEPDATLEAYALDSGERRWSRELGTRFEYNAPFSNHRPVVYDGTIYATTTDELVAVDAETREIRWRVETDAFSNSPPTVTADGVYAAVDGSLLALDHDGNERWRHSVGSRFRMVAVQDGTVYVPARSSLFAIDAASGDVRWEHAPEDGLSRASPVFADDSVIRASFHRIERVAADGTRKWLVDTPEEDSLLPVVGDGVAFVAGIEGTVVAYELSSGEQLWQTSVGDGEWTQETAPILLDGSVVLPQAQSDGNEVSIHALDVESGDERWSVSAADARIRGPVAASGHLVATTQDRHVNTRETFDSPPTSTVRAYELEN